MMKNLKVRFFLSALTLYSIMAAANSATAAPVYFNEVVQVVNAKPGKAGTGGFAQLRLADDDLVLTDDDKKKNASPIQDDRVITETRSEIVEEEVCDCENPLPPVIAAAFPYWTLGFAAVPLAFLVPPGDDDNESPTTSTPPTTPTPTTPAPPAPVPEPMTIILFGTGLASIGMAARRRFGKKTDEENEA
ncbi:MAG: hypothetical protein AVDCRST_MAG74-2471 [uncultured Pyrinomonadaceae bacterium]|uniref:Ice-binding protein C-terminal domain-containing protein n=1 Tax=uncultured Pyrinomonadaceae bacterium TaxID=2283094 RepID=A0A6J4PG91_9BACT|nr:MAG: hypothetical protein AVDCRST_MAG74-2471 [uncultured Pyrinomonadaceae bacterium]